MQHRLDVPRLAAEMTRATELESIDSLGVDRVLRFVRMLTPIVNGWGVWPEVQVKIGRAIVERRISAVRVAELLDAAIVRHQAPPRNADGTPNRRHVASRGAFLVQSIKNEIAKNGFSWDGDNEQP